MSEEIVIECDYRTARAIQAAQEFDASLKALQKSIDDAAKSSDKLDKTTTDIAQTAPRAASGVKQLGDASASAKKGLDDAAEGASKAGKAIDTAKSATSDITASMKGLDSLLPSVAKGFSGVGIAAATISTAVSLYRQFAEQLKEVAAIREKMIQDKAGIDEKAQGLIANLGLKNDSAGQATAMQVLRDMKQRAPGASLDVIGSVLGQTQAIYGSQKGFDVTAKGSGQDLGALFAGFAASMQLNPDEAGGLPLIVSRAGGNDVKSATKILAQMKSAGAATAIPNQSDFMKELLRTAAAQMPQGMDLSQVSGLLASSALGTTEPRIAGTRAEQAMSAVIGKDDQGQAVLGAAALRAGVLSAKDVDAAAAKIPETSQQRDQREAVGRKQQELADAESDLKQRRDNAPLRAADRQHEIDRTARSKDPGARAAAVRRVQVQEEADTRWEREQLERIDRLRQDVPEGAADLVKKRQSAALASAYRALPAGSKLEFVRSAAAGMSAPERTEFFKKIGASNEEIAALTIVATSSNEFNAAQSAVRNVGKKEMADVGESIRGFEQSSLGRAQSSRDTIALRGAQAVKSEDEEQENFKEQSMHRANILIEKWGEMSAEDKSATGLEYTTNARKKIAVYQHDIIRQIYRFWAGMSIEERQAHPEIQQYIVEAQTATDFLDESTYSNLDRIYRAFVRSARQVIGSRARGQFKTRTEGGNPTLSQRVAGGNRTVPFVGPEALQPDKIERITGGREPDLDVGPDSAPSTESGATTRPSGPQPSASATSNASQIFNIHVGNMFTQPGGDLDLPGRLEGLV